MMNLPPRRDPAAICVARILLGFGVFLLSTSSLQAFVVHQQQLSTAARPIGSSSTRLSKPLLARRKASQGVGGGGFGVTTASRKGNKSKKKRKARDETAVNSDYAVFPPLDENVVATLVPARDTNHTVDAEIYQRLEQIYGFPLFNYDTPSLSPQTVGPASTDLGSLLSTHDEDESQDIPVSSSLDHLPPFDDNNIHVLHVDPLILTVDQFFTPAECDRMIAAATSTTGTRSPTVGHEAQAQRTSTTYYHAFDRVPELISKASRLLGIRDHEDDLLRWEETQTVCYRRGETFTWHWDALHPSETSTAGQRVATVLVYLTDMDVERDGGATLFRDLGGDAAHLSVAPTKGTALMFFPAAGGIGTTKEDGPPIDYRTLHCGQMVSPTAANDKWIAQLWLRERPYTLTAPPGNSHSGALPAIDAYCRSYQGDNLNNL